MSGGITVREMVVLGFLAALLVAGGVWRALQQPALNPERIAPVETAGEGRPEAEPPQIIVHLVGAVREPGVYQLPHGSRVIDLVELAGGLTPDADEKAVNLARPLMDGEQIIIYRIGEQGSGGAVPAKININRATAEELTVLPGIGPARAQRIVEHREKHGPFRDITEIMDVSGIGQGIFSAIEELITVY